MYRLLKTISIEPLLSQQDTVKKKIDNDNIFNTLNYFPLLKIITVSTIKRSKQLVEKYAEFCIWFNTFKLKNDNN
jgi:hypothetical protein